MGDFYYATITLKHYTQVAENQYFNGYCNKKRPFFPINLFYMR